MTTTTRPHPLYWPAMHAADAVFDAACRAIALIRKNQARIYAAACVALIAVNIVVPLALTAQEYTQRRFERHPCGAMQCETMQAMRAEINHRSKQ